MRTLPAGSGLVGGDGPNLKSGARPRVEGASSERSLAIVSAEGARPPEPSTAPISAPVPRARTLPPLDPTVSPRAPAVRRNLATPKPVLASECLRDDIAPIEPAARATMGWYLASGAALLALGAVLALATEGSLRDAAISGALGAAICAVPLARSYRARAVIALGAAIAIALLGVVGLGPAAAWHGAPLSHLARFLAPIALASPLLLRSTYRAYRAVRVAIAVGVALFALSALYAGGAPLWNSDATLLARIVGALVAFVAALSLLGFMSEQTTGGCAIWATCTIVFGGASFAIEAIGPGGVSLAALVAGLAALVSIGVAAAAIYQLSAIAIGPRARAAVERFSVPMPDRAEDELHDATLPGD